MVGVLMLDAVKKINFTDVTETFPAFITMITMVLCYSIADGICLGMLSYVVMKLCCFKFKDLSITLLVLAVVFIFKFVAGEGLYIKKFYLLEVCEFQSCTSFFLTF